MDPVTASQIFVGGMFVLYGLSATKLSGLWYVAILTVLFAIGLTTWFAYASGLWPFYYLAAMHFIWLIVTIVTTIRKAIKDAQDQS